jgi:hypothetical protein
VCSFSLMVGKLAFKNSAERRAFFLGNISG